MQMLIDKEMSKQKDSKHYLPNVVAKLMGLETLPRGEPNLSMERSYRSAYPQQMNGPVGFPFRHWQQEDRFMDREILHEVHPSTEQVAYKEMYEIWQQSQRAKHASGKVPDRGRWSEDVDGKRMALIRQKFIEAKHLSTDERMRQSKQFKDALEVLSSNSDLLMRLLDSQNVYEFYSSRRTDTNRITLIKPLKMDDNDKPARKEKRKNRLIKKSPNVDQAPGWENTNSGNSPDSQKVDESPVRTTRIVLLKPSPGRTPEQKDAVSPTSPQNLRRGNCHQGPEYDDAIESITVAKEITQQMHKGLWSYQKDKTPHYSSVISNGYSDDESSFNKSYHEYASANFSDLEAMSMSPLPRLSWDYNYINGCSSPYSTMSLGRVPCSPESSVCREAKKRLSERWTMMTSDKGPQEQTKVRRNSTLGEMLSLTHMKKSATSLVESIQEDREPGKSVSCSHSFNAEISIEGSPKNLPRSNSVPASSTVNGTELTVQVADPKTGKSQASRAQTKSKRRPTFKEKVASLLFSKSKKSTKEKPSFPESKDASQPAPIATEALVFPAYAPEVLRDDESQIINVDSFEEFSLVALCESSEKTSTNSVANRQEEDMITLEPGLAVAGSMMLEINSSESPDQPSPFSVLQPPFEDDNNNVSHESLDRMKNDQLGSQVELKSNLIDKSPPIESIARTLSWDDSSAEVASPHLLKPLMIPSLDSKIEEKEWLLLVHNLLSAAGLDDQQQYDSFYTRWYSLESPLDPTLRDTLLNEKEPQPMHEGRRRKMKSNHKLVFDCINAALLELVGYGSEKCLNGSGNHCRVLIQESAPESTLLVDHIVAKIKELMASGVRCEWDSNSLVVENVVRKEIVQIGWVDLMKLEIDELGKEIERDLIQELVENAVVDFTGRA